MPPRRIRRAKRMNKKRAYKKRRTVLANTKALQPFAQRYITTLKYCETFKPLNTPTGMNVWQLRLNSIFDPNLTGVGHQPYGRDQFEPIYGRYRVISCSYVINAWSSDGAAIQVAALPANEAHTPAFSSASEIRENPRAKYIVQNGQGADFKTLRGKVYLPSLVGRNKSQYMADDRFQATMGSSPAENAVLNIYAQMVDEQLLINPSTVFAVTLKYTVEFFDAKVLPQS